MTSLVVDHVGIVVRSLADAQAVYEGLLGFRRQTDVIEDPVQQVRVQFFINARGERLELVEPSDATSPAANALSKGGGANHVGLRCDDLDAMLALARQHHCIVVCPPVPATGHGGRRIAFIYHPQLGLIELVEYRP